MESLSVVNLFDEPADPLTRIFQVQISRVVNFLFLERSHKPLSTSIVVGIATAAHAYLDLVVVQQRGILGRRILNTAIRMVNQAFGFPATLLESHPKGSKC